MSKLPSAPVNSAPPRPAPHVPPTAPRGQKLSGNIGPGTLYPGAGKLVQRTGQPLYCGTMTGQVFGFTEHPNAKDLKRTSTRFAGHFLIVDHAGIVSQGAECYLPGTVERAIKAALGLGRGEPVPFSVEVWCEPDPEGRPPSPLGYSYVVYNRQQMQQSDPVLALAYASGILEAPAPKQPALGLYASTDDIIDPETGEVTRAPARESVAA